MSKLIELVYVGKKPFAFDNVAYSGKCWNGRGDVQAVTDAQARLLLKYPDQWALNDAKDQDAVDNPQPLQTTDENGNSVEVDVSAMRKPLERMAKTELKAYAHEKWGKNLDARKSTKEMIDQIEEWERDLDRLRPGTGVE